jgi:hypothetical protein
MSQAAGVLSRQTLDHLQNRITMNGWTLFFIGLSLIGSGFSRFRVVIAGLMVHPYLFIVALFFPLLAISRLALIPTRFLLQLFLFAAIYFIASFQGGVQIGGATKLLASVITILTIAMLVRTWGDLTMGVLGMSIGVGVLAFLGVSSEEALATGTIKAVEGGNRNAYSLYALPPVLFGSYILMRNRSEPMLIKAVMAAAVLLIALCLCLNTNRSGWIGLALIMAMLSYEKSFKAAIIFAALGSVVLAIVMMFYSTRHLERRVEQSKELSSSDAMRRDLIIQSILIGLENPMLGVSPKNLHIELANRLGWADTPGIDTHNVYGHIIGGCGLVAFFIFCYLGRELWRWQVPHTATYYGRFGFLEARKLLRYTIILFCVRGIFAAEILFAPCFCIAIGLGIGWATVNSKPMAIERRSMRRPQPLALGGRMPT